MGVITAVALGEKAVNWRTPVVCGMPAPSASL